MQKMLTNVGNSKALLLPKRLIEKYQLDKVELVETEEGILIVPFREESNSFQEKLRLLRQNKDAVYNRMRQQSENPETVDYYNGVENLGETEVDFVEE